MKTRFKDSNIQKTDEYNTSGETTFVSARVLSIPNLDEFLDEGYAISPWGQIFQISELITVKDGYTGEEVPAVIGTVQEKEKTIGLFEVRPESGIIFGIEFKNEKFGLTHKIWTAFDSIEHYWDGGTRDEFWNLALSCSSVAQISGITKNNGEINHWLEWINFEESDYNELKDYMIYSCVLEPEGYNPIVWDSSNGFRFEEDISDLEEVRPFIELLEKEFVYENRRNCNRYSY